MVLVDDGRVLGFLACIIDGRLGLRCRFFRHVAFVHQSLVAQQQHHVAIRQTGFMLDDATRYETGLIDGSPISISEHLFSSRDACDLVEVRQITMVKKGYRDGTERNGESNNCCEKPSKLLKNGSETKLAKRENVLGGHAVVNSWQT